MAGARLVVIVAWAIMAGVAGAPTAWGQGAAPGIRLEVKETSLWKYEDSLGYSESPDANHLAYIAKRDGKKCAVVRDGVEGKKYDWIWREAGRTSDIEGGVGLFPLIFSPDSKHLAYVAVRGGKVNTDRLGREKVVGGKCFVVVNGVEGREYDTIMEGSVVFSPDSKRVAYTGRRGMQWTVVVDEVEGKAYDKWMSGSTLGVEGEREQLGEGWAVFSPDSKRVAYIARRAVPRGTVAKDGTENVNGCWWYCVVDGVEGKEYDGIKTEPPMACVVFSPDSSHVAYVADVRNAEYPAQVAVVDEAEGKRYGSVDASSLLFSPDSKRLAYVAYPGNQPPGPQKEFVVVDGVEGDLCERVGRPLFSPDSKHAAYWANLGNKYLVVQDGKGGKVHEGREPSKVMFSPDSARLAYVLGLRSVVVDGKQGKLYEWVEDLQFSPDSKHAAYLGLRNHRSVIVIDGVEGKEHPDVAGYMGSYGRSVWALAYSPDSKHLVHFGTRGVGKAAGGGAEHFQNMIGVDEVEQDCLVPSPGCRLVFDGPDSFHGIATKGEEWVRFEVKIVEP